MADVEIEYGVPCGLLDSAIETERALLSELGQELDGVRLKTGHGGVFRVAVDGELVFDKDGGDAYDNDAILDSVRERLATT